MCVRCRRGSRAIDRGRAIGEYDGALRSILHAFKYQRCRTLAVPIATLMARYGSDLLRDADLLIPVPLHPRRRMTRGFNQAEELAENLGLPVVNALRRVRHTRPQVELPAGQRHRNVRGAFALGGWLSPRRERLEARLAASVVVLVDDVTTTGATLEACARELKRVGVREVRSITAARAAWKRPR